MTWRELIAKAEAMEEAHRDLPVYITYFDPDIQRYLSAPAEGVCVRLVNLVEVIEIGAY